MDALEMVHVCCHSHRTMGQECTHSQLRWAHAAGFWPQAVNGSALGSGWKPNEALSPSSFTLQGQKLKHVGWKTREGPCQQSGHALGEAGLLCPIVQPSTEHRVPVNTCAEAFCVSLLSPHCTDTASTLVLTASGASAGAAAAAAACRSQSCAGEGTASAPRTLWSSAAFRMSPVPSPGSQEKDKDWGERKALKDCIYRPYWQSP